MNLNFQETLDLFYSVLFYLQRKSYCRDSQIRHLKLLNKLNQNLGKNFNCFTSYCYFSKYVQPYLIDKEDLRYYVKAGIGRG